MSLEQISSFGVPMLILAAVGIALWRITVFLGRKFFGDERKGTPGLVDNWITDLATRLKRHEDEQTKFGAEVRTTHSAMDTALQLLVESESPPIGAAFVAAKTVHQTAVEVARLRGAAMVATKICRVIAQKFPDIEAEIDEHCAEIERIIKGVS